MEKHSKVDGLVGKTFFRKHHSICIRGRMLDIRKPLVMTILNLTPDSFYTSQPNLADVDKTLHYVEKVLDDTDILDLGAVSTRPGAAYVDSATEMARLLPHLEAIVKQFPDLPVSVDTYRSEVAERAVNAGASVINDISAGEFDANMFETVAKLRVPYIMMHMKGTPETMQINPEYEDVVGEVMMFFAEKVEKLRKLGVADIILDPGFGFGKTTDHNYKLLKHLAEFRIFELPVMVGVSRKSMIQKALQTNGDGALNGTSVLNTWALIQGADILRVHDPKEAKQAVQLIETLIAS